MTHWIRLNRYGTRLVLIHDGKRIGSVSYDGRMWAPRIKGKPLKPYFTCSGAKMLVERINGVSSEWFKRTLKRIESDPRIVRWPEERYYD